MFEKKSLTPRAFGLSPLLEFWGKNTVFLLLIIGIIIYMPFYTLSVATPN